MSVYFGKCAIQIYLSGQALQIIMPMWELSNRLHKIRSDMRKEHLSALMKKVRAEVQRSQDEALLAEIIAIPPEKYKQSDLEVIVEMVNKDMTVAIAHFGNLVIDRFFTAQFLHQIPWKIGNNDKWTWLINAFSEIGFCTAEMLEYIVKRIITKRSNFNLQNALEAFQKSFKLNLGSISYLSNHSELVLALSNHAYDAYDRIPLMVLTILTTATSQDQKVPHNIYLALGQARIVQLLLHNFMKIQSVHRALIVQIANNFLLSGIGLEAVRLRIFETATVEKERVKLQISYYLKGFAENAPEDLILFHIKRHSLLEILQNFSKISSANPKYDQQISQNASQALSVIFQRFNSSSQTAGEGKEKIIENMEKMLDESEVQTLYGEQSSAMIE